MRHLLAGARQFGVAGILSFCLAMGVTLHRAQSGSGGVLIAQSMAPAVAPQPTQKQAGPKVVRDQKDKADEAEPDEGDKKSVIEEALSMSAEQLRSRIAEIERSIAGMQDAATVVEKATAAKTAQTERLKISVVAASKIAAQCKANRLARDAERQNKDATPESLRIFDETIKACEEDQIKIVNPALRQMKLLEARLVEDLSNAQALSRANQVKAASEVTRLEVLKAILGTVEGSNR